MLKPYSPNQLRGLDRDSILQSIKDIYVSSYKPVSYIDSDASLQKGNDRIRNLKPKKFANGGVVNGFGNTDSVHAMLTPGEFVMNKAAVEKLGVNNLASLQHFANGGPVGNAGQQEEVGEWILAV